MLPLSAAMRPATHRASVDFPLPDSPTTHTVSPSRADRDTSSRAKDVLVPSLPRKKECLTSETLRRSLLEAPPPGLRMLRGARGGACSVGVAFQSCCV